MTGERAEGASAEFLAAPVKSALIVRNPKKTEFAEIESSVRHYLKTHKIAIARNAADADFLITLGGDGTIFYAHAKYRDANLPIFGIGTVKSYICQATNENWAQKLSEMLKGAELEKRYLLSYTLGSFKGTDALCDIVLVRSIHNKHLQNPYRIIPFQITVDGEPVQMRADGLIFSTATGSTAYNSSVGGPALPMDSTNYVMAGIAPYRVPERFRILSGKCTCRVEAWPEINLALVVDGMVAKDPAYDCTKSRNPPPLEIFQSKDAAKFLKSESPSHVRGLEGKDQFFAYHFNKRPRIAPVCETKKRCPDAR